MFPGQFLTLLVVAVSLTLGQLISRNEFDRLRLEAASSKRIFRQATGAGVPKPDLLKKSIAFSNPRASGKVVFMFCRRSDVDRILG